MAAKPRGGESGSSQNSRQVDDGDSARSSAGSLIQALQRGMAVLLSFDSEHKQWSLGDLTKHVGLRRTTVFRLVKTLQSEGLITVNPSNGKYALGPSVFKMAYVWISEAELARIAMPHLERLTSFTGETANLSTWSGDGPICIAHSPTPRLFKPRLFVGQTFTDLANSDSKILLAFGPEERRVKALQRQLEPLTPFTITDSERMADGLRRVASEGVAYDLQEQHLGVCAIGVPVWDFTNELRASLSLVVSEVRYGPAESRGFVQALKQVAAALSYDLGYRGDSGPS